MTQTPDLCRHATLTGKWIVSRNATIIVQTNNFAQITVHVLRRIKLLALT